MKSSFKKNLPLIIILIIASIVRLYQVTSIPVSLSWDEAAIGWNAKSIFHTRRDEYGKLLPLVFKSFGDYKAPLYIYLTAPIVGIFGLSTFNIRILSIISGVVSVISIYLLVKNQTKNKNKALISSLLFAITPWSIIFSRGAFEQNLSVALILLGTYLFFTAFKKPKILFLSTISFTLSLYAYHSAKIFTPLLTLYLIFLYKEELFSKKNDYTLKKY